jgi:hypothetical protein
VATASDSASSAATVDKLIQTPRFLFQPIGNWWISAVCHRYSEKLTRPSHPIGVDESSLRIAPRPGGPSTSGVTSSAASGSWSRSDRIACWVVTQ